ncbi:MAG: thioredoxin domain-containing protein [Crocinitomicaceae bacterium]|tara:strand:- start:4911 stop:6917 length:2007 start_codon:yes stop_codon:yes gene_type:complete
MKDNLLHLETSLYLLQHANNPVHWRPWSQSTLDFAKAEGKLMIVSIGYSSCHWCHVMENESFEDLEVAEIMNTHFVNVKVDREERPDIDQLYMSSVQLMGVQGGWPLNCILLPDGRPIYGGTYFKKEKWIQILKAVVETYERDAGRVEEFAREMNDNLQDQHFQFLENDAEVTPGELKSWVIKWKTSFDTLLGGYQYVPKFPLPNHMRFMLDYGLEERDQSLRNHVHSTLKFMGNGGIFDHVEGGFSRYSTDAVWKVPHFEKMLYDNAQLISLYSLAALSLGQQKDVGFYKSIVMQTYEWLATTLKTSSGFFLCSQDADTEGEEGAYYCWTEKELKAILKENFNWFQELYSIDEHEIWEQELYILQKKYTHFDFAQKQNWSEAIMESKIHEARTLLSNARSKRIKPLIDTKSLTSWNSLLIQGFCHAYVAFGNEYILKEALSICEWLVHRQFDKKTGVLYRNNVNGKASIDGFLDDYANAIQALICLYQTKGDLDHLMLAKKLVEIVEVEFFSKDQNLCYYTKRNTKLIARKIDVDDDVMPSSNSVMAHNFYSLGYYFRNERWIQNSKEMLQKVKGLISKYPGSYVNWMGLYYRILKGPAELSVLGQEAISHSQITKLQGLNILVSYHRELAVSAAYSDDGIYLCRDKVCLPKMKTLDEAIIHLNSSK